MALHSERCLIGCYPIWFTDVFSKSHFYFITICGTWAVEAILCVQKSKKHFKIWLRQTVTNVRLSFVFTLTRKRSIVKTNQPHASQICIGVIIVLSIKTQSLCDVLNGQELMRSKVGKMLANKHICHASGIYREISANNGKYWQIWFTTVHT